jgi:hypothetical protein
LSHDLIKSEGGRASQYVKMEETTMTREEYLKLKKNLIVKRKIGLKKW